MTVTRDDKLALIRSAAYARALGLSFVSWGGGEARLRLPQSPRISAAEDSTRIDQRAVIGLLDDVSGLAIGSVIAPEVGMSTVSLRIDFLQPSASRGATGHARYEGTCGEMALIRGTVTDDAGEAVANSTAWFHVGAYPGQSSSDTRPVSSSTGTLELDALGRSFDSMFGASRAGPDIVLPRAAHLFGGASASIPAMHGGAIGALLATACQDQLRRLGRPDMGLISLSISYLRAANATLLASTSVRRVGSRIAFIDVTLRGQNDPTVVATAECVCARIR